MGGKTTSIRQIARYHAEQQRLIHPIKRYFDQTIHFLGCSVLGQQQLGDWQLQLHCLGQQGVAMDNNFINEWISIADAVVFVVDSQRNKLQQNIIALKTLPKCSSKINACSENYRLSCNITNAICHTSFQSKHSNAFLTR